LEANRSSGVLSEFFLSFFIYLSLLFIAVQERLTKQIASALTQALQPAGVAVVIEAA
jgi:predicted membrane-bound dolichyl-phosphate-mannose-protein mannosyltransferase